MRLKIFILIFLLLFSACNGDNRSLKEESNDFLDKDNNSIDNGDYKVLKLNKGQVNLRLDEPKDVYLLFTNPYNTNQKIRFNNKVKNDTLQKIVSQESEIKNFSIEHAPKHIMNFNHQTIKITKEFNYRKEENIGDREVFYLEKDTSISTQATKRKSLKNIQTKYGDRTLTIWVSDDSFGENCSKIYCIEQNMIDKLADSFLKDGDDNDIYDWVTNIFGKEWDSTNNPAIIEDKQEISILLTDINSDNRASGGVLGYFYAKDNYRKEVFSGSNEQLMFYIDSVIFASHIDNERWDIEKPKQKKVLSTLAHEFEHMIQFYQKNIIYGNSGLKPWIDEMLAVTVEDIIATKLKSKGLRGVSYTRGDAGEKQNIEGKFPLFNKNINLSLPTWDNKLEDYSKVGAFGSYLIRNYGGAELLHNILHNRYTDKEAIVTAVHKSPNGYEKNFDTLMHDWGIAVLLSSNTTLGVDSGYLYNLGDFLVTEYGDSSYEMGSINFFNYQSKPNIIDKITDIRPNSNLYYKFGSKLKGDINITIEQNQNIITTVIVK